MRYHATSGESERIYTTHPREYPVGGRKALNVTPWAERVLTRQQPYLGRTPADVQSVFFDHDLIASLGCGSVLNLPVVWDGRTLGTINLLHEEGWYDDGDCRRGAAVRRPGHRRVSHAGEDLAMSGFADYEAYDALGLAGLVRQGKVTPVELLDAAIARVEARNAKVNAVDDAALRLRRARPSPRGYPTGRSAACPSS